MRALGSAPLVALLLAPSLLAAQTRPVRLDPGACDWGHQRDVSWGRRVLAVSAERDGAANRATGRPDVWPQLGTGDAVAPLTWAPGRGEVWPEWIALSLQRPIAAREIWLFVTGGAGAEMRVAVFDSDGSMIPVARLEAVQWPGPVAQIVVPLDTAIVVSAIRVEVEPSSVDGSFFLDAVAAVPRRVCVPGPSAPRGTR
jgi:hypothetical protein